MSIAGHVVCALRRLVPDSPVVVTCLVIMQHVAIDQPVGEAGAILHACEVFLDSYGHPVDLGVVWCCPTPHIGLACEVHSSAW
jgi:hypothetical protein